MYLLIGDMHCTEKEIDDCEALAGYILAIVRTTKARPIFLGDLYDSHAIIRAEVQKFWYDFLFQFIEFDFKPILLTGNHDRPTNRNSLANALLAHINQAIVVRDSHLLDGVLFMPYLSNDIFIKECNKYKTDLVICHQTFTGAQYENGFYAKDGINPDIIPQKRIISGHIHTTSSFGKVEYIGAPRWRNFFDSKQSERWLYLMDNNFNLIKKYPTSEFCKVIHHIEINETFPIPKFYINSKDLYNIDIYGKKDFIDLQKELYPNARIRIFQEKKETATILTESDPINMSLEKWFKAYVPEDMNQSDFLECLKTDFFYKKYFG